MRVVREFDRELLESLVFGSNGLECQDDPHDVWRFASEYNF